MAHDEVREQKRGVDSLFIAPILNTSTLKVAIMVGLYCSSVIAFADPVLLFEKYVG